VGAGQLRGVDMDSRGRGRGGWEARVRGRWPGQNPIAQNRIPAAYPAAFTGVTGRGCGTLSRGQPCGGGHLLKTCFYKASRKKIQAAGEGENPSLPPANSLSCARILRRSAAVRRGRWRRGGAVGSPAARWRLREARRGDPRPVLLGYGVPWHPARPPGRSSPGI
jgi:hypothetical protein